MGMNSLVRNTASFLAVGLSISITACGGGAPHPTHVSTYGLTVASANPASGVAITVSPADLNGAANGTTSFTRTYDSGTSVTLTAPAMSGSNTFSSWTGCTSASTVTCTVAMNADATVTANYATPVPTYTLTVNSTNPASGVTIDYDNPLNNVIIPGVTSFTATEPAGTTLNLTAPATAAGNNFASWSGCTSATGAGCSVTLNANMTVTANYATPVPTYTLTVNSTNPASGVTIDYDNPLNNVIIPGVTSFTATEPAGTTLNLTAPATAGGNNFASWSGCTSATGAGCSVTLNANMTVTANYATPPPTAYALTVNSVNPASGVAIGAAPADLNGTANGTTGFTLTYNAGTSVTLTAPASSGGSTVFLSWTGCTSASTVTCTVTLNGNTTVTANYAYVLTVNSTNPSSGVTMTVTYPPTTLATQGTTSFTVNGEPGENLVIAAPATTGGNTFSSWTGCTTTSTVNCNVTLNANTTVTANYVVPAVAVLPNPATAIIGGTLQFTAKVNGTVSSAVTWSVAAPSGSSLSPGTVSSTGLFTTPYPAPATVTVTATSTANKANSGSVVVTLSAPAATSGPALTVDTSDQTHAINPYIYGWNAYSLITSSAKAANITVDRFGGDATSRYNYQLDVTNSASDWYFENGTGATGQQETSEFNTQVANDAAIGAKTLGTVDVLGWVAKNGTSCSFPESTYPNQYAHDPYNANCGDGETSTQADITGNDPTVTSTAVGPSWAGGWVAYLVSKFGTAANGGVAFYDLDNEPAWWDAVHRDVHPVASTYDEVTNNGIATALAIKTADPTAAVNGPVIDYWWNYFYSKKDIEAGWGSAYPSCWQPWSNPVDRNAHGGVPFIEYYLQQFAAYQTAHNLRLLDYLDLHTYFAPTYNGSGLGFATAGDTGAQQARLNSTRVFWDPTYTDPNYPQPNYPTDAKYTTSCNVPLQAPQLIPMAQGWVAKDYPGTKVAFTEYNWGGLEHINGALTQADILGIFGAYGLDMATLWGPPDPSSQVPGLMAYEIYRNYDGKNSTFGDMALASTSANQGQLSVYGALRTADNTLTVMVINKTYGDLTSTVSLAGLPATATSGQAYLYSNANLNAIVAQPAVTITPGSGGAPSTIASYTFPAQSITLFVVPI